MSEQGSRKSVLLAISAAAATCALIFAYRRYSQSINTPAASLHRSNAIRRSRRRWRRGFAPRELDYNILEKSLSNLSTRIEEGQPYGRYDNRLLFTIEEEHLEAGLFDLLPSNITQIYTILSQVRLMSEVEKDKLRFHVSSLFVQNFLLEEFPSGYIIGEDVEHLVQILGTHGIDEDCVRMMVHYFDHGKPLLPENWDVRDEAAPGASNTAAQSDAAVERTSTQQAIEALAGPTHGDESDYSDDDDDESDPGGSQNMLDLLYHIASEQAKREGFIHRDAICNSCGQKPIQGIRYHCANCFDYDLCEDCEAQQVHNRSHIFYKVRIPRPTRGHIKQVAPVWYPGQPNAFPSTMPRDLQRRLVEETGVDKTEMEASYEQFKCLAGESIPVEDDPTRLGMAISRQNFDMFFTPTSADRPPPPNLIYDRIFAFYDYHKDGVITLDEFIVGIANIMDKSRGARLKRMFMGYDLDTDGYVDRKDFLRMFRAYYALSKELNREMIELQDDLDDDIRDVVQGSQPISAAFSGHQFASHVSRAGQDKELSSSGDLVISEGPNGVLQTDTEMRGDRSRAIGNAAVRGVTRAHPFRSFRQQPEPDEQLLRPHFTSILRDGSSTPIAEVIADEDLIDPAPALHVYDWPPRQIPEPEDIVNALGVDIPLDDVTDPIDRSRVIYAQLQRLDEESDTKLDAERAAAVKEFWRRRQFYLDEEEGLTEPPGYTEPDSSEDEAASIDEPEAAAQTSSSSRRQSMRSRSSSKVRFDDSAIDTDHETRSNTSSRSVPVNERWGGFELSAPEREIGKEILYQAVQQGFNELLNPLFKKKEDDAMEAIGTRTLRTKWSIELDEFEAATKKRAADKTEALREADMLRTQALFSNGVDNSPEARPDALDEPASTRIPEQEEADHIQIIVENNQDILQGTTKVSEPDPLTISQTGESPDPTLPQNKPNDPTIFMSENMPEPPSDVPDSSSIPPSEPILRTWLQHRKIDQEAHERGGYGKLSYREFCRLMIREANRDIATEALNVAAGIDPITGKSDEDEAAEDEQIWSSSGDLGKMSFCGTWLERALF